MRTRGLARESARRLAPGDDHYMAFVGPPAEYDLIGASQFRLLTTLGLRSKDRVLDFGCGSLRLGRLLIPYLDPGLYHGLDPNAWLIDDAIRHEIGEDLVRIKQPRFFTHDDFDATRCGGPFDVIVAQSIFSHTGRRLMERVLERMARCMASSGIVVFTAIHSDEEVPCVEDGWVYPETVAFSTPMIDSAVAAAGLSHRRLPWFHPRQSWHVAARTPSRLPGPDLDRHLQGATIGVDEWSQSLGQRET